MSTVNPIPEALRHAAAAPAERDRSRLSARELGEIATANASGRPIVVFVHGLWLLAGSWNDWRRRFEHRGYATIAPAWPGDPETVEEARADPTALAGNSLATVTAHHHQVIAHLRTKPILVGHSFGGLVVQQLAGAGLATCTVAISPAPGRGIWRTSATAVRAGWPVLRNPANRHRPVALTFQQFRYAFAGAVDVDQARRLYETYVVPGAGRLLFQSAAANMTPRTEARVDTAHPARGPMKIIAGERDRIVPWSVARAAFRLQRRNSSPTEYFEAYRRAHSLTIDNGWEDIADTTLRFVHRFSARL